MLGIILCAGDTEMNNMNSFLKKLSETYRKGTVIVLVWWVSVFPSGKWSNDI